MKFIKLFEDIFDDWDEDETPDIPYLFIGYEDFYDFLYEHNTVDEFVLKFNPVDEYRHYKNLQQYLKDVSKCKIINHFTDWLDTPSGYKYWSDLNNKWHKKCG